MWQLLLLVALAALAMGRDCPTPVRDDLLICLAHVDANEDGTLTVAELDTWIGAHSECLPATAPLHYSGAAIMAACDADASGNLTMTDWHAPGGCLVLPSRQRLLCDWCVKCGVYPE